MANPFRVSGSKVSQFETVGNPFAKAQQEAFGRGSTLGKSPVNFTRSQSSQFETVGSPFAQAQQEVFGRGRTLTGSPVERAQAAFRGENTSPHSDLISLVSKVALPIIGGVGAAVVGASITTLAPLPMPFPPLPMPLAAI